MSYPQITRPARTRYSAERRYNDVHHVRGSGTRLTRDRNSAKPKTFFDVEHVLDNVIGTEDDGIRDEAILMPLDGAHHRGLFLGRLVVMNDTDPTEQLETANIRKR